MKNIVGIRFKKPGKIYFFDPGNLKINVRDHVIVDTTNGEEYAEVAIANRLIPEEKLVAPLRKVIRIATPKDEKHNKENKQKEKEAFDIAIKKIKKHQLEMKLIDVEYKFDNTKIIFYFTAEGRIDFRELVKDLAAVFKTRIELRQIGVRDEVRRIGGNGVCGRELCCCSFLNNFEAVSIKLMCCLKYEQEVYEEKNARLPKVGAIVKTEEGEGVVDSIETLKEKIRVKFRDGDGYFYKKYSASDVKIIKNVESKNIDPEEKEHSKELEELEKLEEKDRNEQSNEE